MEKISVIMPVYNAEKFIRQSINSILTQTHRNIEIILVDDGSKDLSGKICDEYSKIDSRIKVIHKENGGSSSARNMALDVATGKYIMFIDADDFYENNSCELLYNEIEKTQADYVIGNYFHTNYKGEKWKKPVFDFDNYNGFKLEINNYEKSFFIMNTIIWNKIYRKDFIQKNNLRFIDSDIAEDAVFSTYCYVHTDKCYFINDIVYNYRQNQLNTSVSTSCTKHYFEKLNTSYKLIFKNFETTNNLSFYRLLCARMLPYLLCKIIDSNALNNNQTIEVLEMLNWFFEQKELYGVVIINDRLNQIIEYINNKDYMEAIYKIKETEKYRMQISDIEKQKMYSPNEELYRKMLNR